MNLIQFKQVAGLASTLNSQRDYIDTVSGYLDREIWYLMTGNNTFTGRKTFKDDVHFLQQVTGEGSGNFKGGLYVGAGNPVLTQSDVANTYVELVGNQNITGIKTFQGSPGNTNTNFKGGTVYVSPWGSVGEIDPALRITGELWITGSDGAALQITRNSPWVEDSNNIYFNDSPTDAGYVGIATSSPAFHLDIAGTGNMIGAFAERICVGGGSVGTQQFVVESSSPIASGAQTGALFNNLTNTANSSTVVRMAADTNQGSGGYGAVDIIATREDFIGTSSFSIVTKTGLGYNEGFDSRFKVSGASIFVNHDTMPLSNPEVRGQLWLKPTDSYPGNSYLMVSSGVAPP